MGKKRSTHIAVAKTAKTYLGTCAHTGANTWKLSPKLYTVTAMFAVTLKLRSTVKNLPKPPAGSSTAASRSPTEPEA
jgi:hypothetical protein